MSEQLQPQNGETQTTVLHVDKFVPAQGAEPMAPVAPDDTATLVIKKAAAQTVEQTHDPVVVPKGGGNAFPPKEMLGTVAYAYAKGVYRSEDLERKLVHDPKIRQALGNDVPDAETIRRFRRLNRKAILATLEKFFGWRRNKQSSATAPAPPMTPTVSPAQTDGETTRQFAQKAAVARLDEATFVDNMSKES